MNYLYLHGFASGVQSRKAQYLTDRFRAQGLSLLSPDLNLGDFSTVTLSKQLQFLKQNYGGQPCYVMGSSLGGLLATLWAIDSPDVESLILLAPAFRFRECLGQTIGVDGIQTWQKTGSRLFYHYGLEQDLPLHYQFYEDVKLHDEQKLQRELPVLIIHGKNDDVVLAERSREFAHDRGYVKLHIVDSDHSLGNVVDYIWQETKVFWGLV